MIVLSGEVTLSLKVDCLLFDVGPIENIVP